MSNSSDLGEESSTLFKKPFKPEITKNIVYTDFTLPSFKQRLSNFSQKLNLEQEQFTSVQNTQDSEKNGSKRTNIDSEKHW
jgi:hypothetical protein